MQLIQNDVGDTATGNNGKDLKIKDFFKGDQIMIPIPYPTKPRFSISTDVPTGDTTLERWACTVAISPVRDYIKWRRTNP